MIVESFPNSAWSFGGCCKLSAVSSRIYAHLNALSQLSNNLLFNKFPLVYHLRLKERVGYAYASAEPGKAVPEAHINNAAYYSHFRFNFNKLFVDSVH